LGSLSYSTASPEYRAGAGRRPYLHQQVEKHVQGFVT
jgi:hypothetical protein